MQEVEDPTLGRATSDTSTSIASPFPIYLEGEVVKGFGRGSKELGIPTANYSQEYVDSTNMNQLSSGIYFGYAYIVPDKQDQLKDNNNNTSEDMGKVYGMVMSLGWNPYYKNEKRSAEVYIIHDFSSDFYGKVMKTLVLGYIRDEKSYKSLEGLKKDIWFDVDYCKTSLQNPIYTKDNFTSYFQ